MAGLMNAVTKHVDAPPEVVYDLVADVTRTGEWSPENLGGAWLDGATGPVVGARFKARNKRKWSWTTTSTVTVADRAREFAFDVGKGETRWRYEFVPAGEGCEVTESFEIVKAPGPVGRFLTKLATGVSWDEREADLVRGMHTTLERLRAVVAVPRH